MNIKQKWLNGRPTLVVLLTDEALETIKKMTPQLAQQHLTGFSLRALRALPVLPERKAGRTCLLIGNKTLCSSVAAKALGSWHPSTGSYKPPSATLQVSSGSRCLGAAVQVSSSTKPPVQQI